MVLFEILSTLRPCTLPLSNKLRCLCSEGFGQGLGQGIYMLGEIPVSHKPLCFSMYQCVFLPASSSWRGWGWPGSHDCSSLTLAAQGPAKYTTVHWCRVLGIYIYIHVYIIIAGPRVLHDVAVNCSRRDCVCVCVCVCVCAIICSKADKG